jgi:peptide/nickel transport system substrate-binding protein
MKKRIILGLLILTLMALPLFAACGEEAAPPSEEEEEEGPPPAEEEEEGDWWDEFGEPEYGGTLTVGETSNPLSGTLFDPTEPFSASFYYFFEGLFGPDWTLDPDIWAYQMGWVPLEYLKGQLAESWEQTDPLTVTVHLREGVYWQDKPPVNGREFTAEDVQYTYDWFLGTGSGFTEPNIFWAEALPNIEQVIATGKYTVQFKLNKPSAMAIYQVLEGQVTLGAPVVAHEWVEQGDLNNWENAVGTGAWMLTDFASGTSLTFSRNPNYWGYDERHPENQLPYASELKILHIADVSAILAAMRTGQIDMIPDPNTGVTWQQAQALSETNPEIQQAIIPFPGNSLFFRCDTEPFTDINVRKALQLAVDLETIAETYYGGTVDGTPAGVGNPLLTEWCTPYDEWPAELQTEYTYDLDAARALLAQTNWPTGFDTNVWAIASSDIGLLQIVQSEFNDIGVDMEIITMDPPTFMSMAAAGEQDQMTFMFGTSMTFSPDRAVRFYLSTNTRDNFTFNNDPEYDALVDQFFAADTMDEAKRLAIEADMYALEQHWAVNLIGTNNPIFWQPWIKGYSGQLTISGQWPAYTWARLWIDQELKESMGY